MSNNQPSFCLSDFVLTNKLGVGTYATVYKAYKKSGLQREVVAIKCIKKSSLTKSSIENLLAEIEILKQIKHENVVQLVNFHWDTNYIYLVMEYCAGGDLSVYIKTQRVLPEYTVRRFLQQIASALQLLHKHNISHMDLKPQNILLSSDEYPTLKLADFGFAQYIDNEQDQHALRGSPLYMAPEMITRGQYNNKVDLWSVGVILYESLFGRAPFASATFVELENKIKSTEPIKFPMYPVLSESCRSLLEGLLQRDPDKRLTFEEFFNHEFVDLEHKPSAECLDKALDLVKEAISEDTKGNIETAVQLYSDAIEYFVPAIYYETVPSKKDTLRKKVSEYCTRAEILRRTILTPNDQTSNNNNNVFDELCSKNEELNDIKSSITRARLKEEEEPSQSLEIYEEAIQKLITLMKDEIDTNRKKIIANEINIQLTRAEKIKSYIKLQRSASKREEMHNAVDDTPSTSRCLLQ